MNKREIIESALPFILPLANVPLPSGDEDVSVSYEHGPCRVFAYIEPGIHGGVMMGLSVFREGDHFGLSARGHLYAPATSDMLATRLREMHAHLLEQEEEANAHPA